MRRKGRNNIGKKVGAFVAAGMMTLAIAVPTMGASSLHYFFSNTATIDSSTVVSTNEFESSSETHTVQLHPSKITKSGYVYADRRKKGLVFWSSEKVIPFNITSNTTYSKGDNQKLTGTYYYNLSNYDEDSVCSNANITFDQGFVKETS